MESESSWKNSFFCYRKTWFYEEDATFFKNINLKKIVENDNNIKESSATKQVDKKSIYAKGWANLKSKLS